MELTIPRGVRALMNRLERHGYEAYVVGGCVRDSILGRMPHDWDVTTSALPHQAMVALEGHRMFETGLQHGTITVLTDDGPVEVTTYRVDGAYSDNRRPDKVRFTPSLREDLARRDFTINALAYRPGSGLVDCFGGEEDLRRRLIRCVGDPDRRFHEDALRILRGLRFASALGFSLERHTADSLTRNRALLGRIASERIRDELVGLLCGAGVLPILLDYVPVITQVIPELAPAVGLDQNNPYHIYTVYEHTAHAVAAVAPLPELRLTMLLHDAGKPATCTEDADGRRHFYGHPRVSAAVAREVLHRLRFDNATIARVVKLVEIHDCNLEPTERCVLRQLKRIGEAVFRELLLVKLADNAAQSEYAQGWTRTVREIEPILERVLAEQRCFSLKDLAVDGTDLLRAGIPAGPAVGQELQRLLDLVLDGACENDRNALLAQIPQRKEY